MLIFTLFHTLRLHFFHVVFVNNKHVTQKNTAEILLMKVKTCARIRSADSRTSSNISAQTLLCQTGGCIGPNLSSL